MMVCNFEEQGAPILVFVVVGGGSTMVFSSNDKKKKKSSSDQFAFPFKSYTITRPFLHRLSCQFVGSTLTLNRCSHSKNKITIFFTM